MTETREDPLELWLRDTLPSLAPAATGTVTVTVDAYAAVQGRIRRVRRRRGQRLGVLAVAAVTALVVTLAVQVPRLGSHSIGTIPLHGPVVFHPLLGEVYRNHAYGLVQVDPLTLRPVGSSSAVPPAESAFSYSPDGSRLAVVHGNGRDDSRVTLLDPGTLRTVRTFSTGVHATVAAIDWTRSGIVEVLGTCGPCGRDTVVRIDPSTGAVTQTPLHGSLQRSVATLDALYVVVGPTVGIGPSRVARLTGSGADALPVTQIHSGLDPASAHPRHQVTPALAVDPTTDVAYVLSPGAPVAVAAFRTGSVTYHSLTQRRSIGELLAGWLIPPASAKEDIDWANWTAQWLGDGLLAMAGSTTSLHTSTPTGLRILNVHTWSQTTLDTTADRFAVADGALIALHDPTDASGADLGGAAVGYDSHGQRLFTIGDTLNPIWQVVSIGARVFAYHYCVGTCTYTVVNPLTGHVIATRPGYNTLATPLIGRTSQGF